jgi:putative FmdB family regulatory protein
VPIYVYECDACQGRFEYSQSLSEPPKTVCESCGGKLAKIIVPIAFHLKGGGWYKDLYSSSKGGESSTTKSETKSETKTEAAKVEPKASESKPGGGGSSST